MADAEEVDLCKGGGLFVGRRSAFLKLQYTTHEAVHACLGSRRRWYGRRRASTNLQQDERTMLGCRREASSHASSSSVFNHNHSKLLGLLITLIGTHNIRVSQ